MPKWFIALTSYKYSDQASNQPSFSSFPEPERNREREEDKQKIIPRRGHSGIFHKTFMSKTVVILATFAAMFACNFSKIS